MNAAAVARDVNARIYDSALRWHDSESHFDFVCECGCFTPVSMSATEYRAAGGARLPGHPVETPGPGSVAA
jgi:hypothetical protein